MSMTKRYLDSLPEEEQDEILGRATDEEEQWFEQWEETLTDETEEPEC